MNSVNFSEYILSYCTQIGQNHSDSFNFKFRLEIQNKKNEFCSMMVWLTKEPYFKATYSVKIDQPTFRSLVADLKACLEVTV